MDKSEFTENKPIGLMNIFVQDKLRRESTNNGHIKEIKFSTFNFSTLNLTR